MEPANVTEMYGVVESPFFPDNYPSGLDCTWVFRYPEGYRLQLEFLSWLLTDSGDYLEILELSPEQSNRPAKVKGFNSNDLPHILSQCDIAVVKG